MLPVPVCCEEYSYKFFQTGNGQLFVFLTIISSIEDTTELFWCRGLHKGGDLLFAELVVHGDQQCVNSSRSSEAAFGALDELQVQHIEFFTEAW